MNKMAFIILFGLLLITIGYQTPNTPQTIPVEYIDSPIEVPEKNKDFHPVVEEQEPQFANINSEELNCLAENIYHEARGESFDGKIAVANVTMNRLKSHRYPDTVCGVVKQAVLSKWWKENHNREVPVRDKCQFSWYCDGKSDSIVLTDSQGKLIRTNMQAWEESLQIAALALRFELDDVTDGATHYFNPTLADPFWAVHYPQTVTIGQHAFHKTVY